MDELNAHDWTKNYAIVLKHVSEILSSFPLYVSTTNYVWITVTLKVQG